MPRKTFKDYYTTGEAMQKLGISQDDLYLYVRNKRLEPYVPPGRKHRVWRKSQVDELVRERRNFDAPPMTTATFAKATPEDMDEAAKLINALFNHWPNVERWKEYLHRNPDIGFLLKTGTGAILGCAFLMPLSLERIQEHLSLEETHTPSILPEEIQPFVVGQPYHLYVRAVGILPGLSKEEKRTYGSRLLKGLIAAFLDLGTRGIEIEAIWARSSTYDGIRTLKRLGFTEIHSETKSRNFVINIPQSGIPEIERYKKALRSQQEGKG